MYRIKEFAAMTGLPPSKIRFYEKHGLLATRREENGYRVFSPEDAFRANAFRVLLQYGFTVEQAVAMLDAEQGTEEFKRSLEDQQAKLRREAYLLRYRLAEEQGVPPYVIFSNVTLADMAAKKPRDSLELLDVDKTQAVMIGDQVFTDVLGANRCGIANILVRYPRRDGETKIGIRRRVEKAVLWLYRCTAWRCGKLVSAVKKGEDSCASTKTLL